MSTEWHHLKTETEYYQAIEKGFKKFELRKNDRGFKVGDMLILEETVNTIKTGREITFEVKYILTGGKFGLQDGYVIMQL